MIRTFNFVTLIILCLCLNKVALVEIEISKKSQTIPVENASTTIATDQEPVSYATTSPMSSTSTTAIAEEKIHNSTESSVTVLYSPTPNSSTNFARNKTMIRKTTFAEDMTSISKLQTFGVKHYCDCDLKVNICDISCCCDLDCSPEMIRTFRCEKYHQTLNPYNVLDGLASCQTSGSWLCVFKNNLHDSMNVHPWIVGCKDSFNWNGPFDRTSVNLSGCYKLGDPVLLLDARSEELHTIDLPYPLYGPHCQIIESIRYLGNAKWECLMTTQAIQTLKKDLTLRLVNSKIFQKPNPSSESNPLLKSCSSFDKSKDLSIYICMQYTSTGETCSELQNDGFNDTDEVMLASINIIFYHNFTCLKNMTTYLHLYEHIAYDDNERKWVSFDVKFVTASDELRKFTKRISHSLGYKRGQPIITAKYVSVDDIGDEKNNHFVLDYFHRNEDARPQNYMPLPKSQNGVCNENEFNTINFDVNTFTQCYVVAGNDTVSSSDNYNQTCEILQVQVFQTMLNHPNISNDFEIYISEFGFPINDSKHWKKLIFNDEEHIPVFATNTSALQGITCHNMILNIFLNFITETVTKHEVPLERYIKSVTLEFGPRVDVEFKIDEEIRVPIYLSTKFQDYDMPTNAAITKAEGGLYIFVLVAPLILCK